MIVGHKATILDLRSRLDNCEAVIPRLCEELSHLCLVCDDTWSYLEGLERMRDHVLLNIQSNFEGAKSAGPTSGLGGFEARCFNREEADLERTFKKPCYRQPHLTNKILPSSIYVFLFFLRLCLYFVMILIDFPIHTFHSSCVFSFPLLPFLLCALGLY